MNILVTGGCGYVGTKLTKQLLEDGHNVVVFDTQWFGNYLDDHSRLKNIKGNIIDVDSIPVEGNDIVIHLANIANDPAVDLHPTLSWEVNVLASQQLADKCVRSGVKQLIYASSGSVYGVKSEDQVTEELSLVPISAYNKTKMVAERVFLSYKNKMKVHCVRPATVCGLSPRMRLDVSVNMLTYQAIKNKKITVFGGNQTRPNIHIDDMVSVYQHFISNSSLESGCYNAGFENITILEIANKISSINNCDIVISESNDPRSYRQNSQKLIDTGFSPRFQVSDAIEQVSDALNSGQLDYNENWFTINTMKKIKL
jgi:nucleoside-diphosphate-sugar epimerase